VEDRLRVKSAVRLTHENFTYMLGGGRVVAAHEVEVDLTLGRIGGATALRVWDMMACVCVCVLEGHTKVVRALCVTGGRVVSASYDASLRD
jgi:hypothetical protein